MNLKYMPITHEINPEAKSSSSGPISRKVQSKHSPTPTCGRTTTTDTDQRVKEGGGQRNDQRREKGIRKESRMESRKEAGDEKSKRKLDAPQARADGKKQGTAEGKTSSQPSTNRP